MNISRVLVAFAVLATVSLAHAGNARLSLIGPESVYAQVGLKSGDIIKSIDGESIQGIEHATSLLYSKAADGEEHTIEIRRGGERMEISFPDESSPD